ncbi:hypothetical protein SMC26_29105 [Actinomadura fulvescens]|uniref:Uncharacterized protein n=1 Tax=Actinomadura fulvescens TaxID=46160 RepID=A0ABP6CCG8_9ACTN
MNEQLQKFIEVGLHVEQANDLESMKEVLEAGSADYAAAVKAGMQELLAERPFSVGDWFSRTYVSFDDEDELYSYLQDAYDYLFEGKGEPPEID